MEQETKKMKKSEIKQILNELLDQLVMSTLRDDAKIKDQDKSVPPNSISESTHLTLTIKQLINEEL
jgi:hypothetical protein